ncbi:LPXTG cell wall anchor domain-containing protein [Listeria weihenstephanensis]|uniref:LPXTG cell wall anchor domain-containing protein n=1 Tax=Listeria weihenstephanensis TaxID=1006155 RepID=A0A841ZC68_9LIST|nr:MucBP domain-containing protein [Listeria weihenstephanensis]MBC1502106.1 LPXTG cell wall anchor domain-containing protein [Listeria weihenstephanensis]
MEKKKRWKKSVLVALTVSCVAFTLDIPVAMLPMISAPAVAVTTDNEPVIFPDENLESAIRSALEVYSTPITQGKMKQLKGLRIEEGRGVSSLEGLQYATNLRFLSAAGSSIGSDIRDITPLANLTSLEFLYLLGNEHLSDINTLSTLIGLKTFRGDWCAIQQVPDLTSLKQLELLSLARNQIQRADFASTLSPSVKELELSFNDISDTSPLAGIHNTKIALIGNHILDVSMLDWESNTILSYGQNVTLPVQKTGKSQLTLANPVLSTRGSVLPPTTINDAGIYHEANQQFVWSTLPTQPTGSVSFSYREYNEKGALYNSGIVTVPYEVADSVPVTVRYVDTAGNTVAPGATLTGEYGTTYTAHAVDIPTYVLTETPENATGSYTETAQTVTFVYDKTDAAPVTARYESTTGKTIAPEEILTGKLDATYTAKDKAIPGYTLTKQPENANGSFTESAQTVRFVYEATAGAPVTVQYVDAQGKALLPETQLNGTFDTTYQAEAPTIAHYTLQDTPTNASGTFTLAPQTVIYRYAQTQGQTVTVSYIDTDGKTLSPDVHLIGSEGTSYQTTAKDITGYHLLRITGQETGTYSAESQQVTYTYQADKEDEIVVVPPVNPKPVDEVVIPPTVPTVPKSEEITPTEESPNPVNSLLANTDESVSSDRMYPANQTLPTTGDKTIDWSVVLGGIVLAYGVYYWRKGRH